METDLSVVYFRPGVFIFIFFIIMRVAIISLHYSSFRIPTLLSLRCCPH